MMKYMVSRCWQKMNRRMYQWQSKGFTHYLTSIAIENFMSDSAQYMSSIEAPKRMDTALTKSIIDLHTSIVHEELTNHVFPQQGFPNLAAACERVRLSKREEQLRVYSKDTCVEFHLLLVYVLQGYRDALHEWSKMEKTQQRGQAVTANEYHMLRLQYAVEVYNFGHLLWRIAYSQALRDHLGMLTKYQQIIVPTSAGHMRGDYCAHASSKGECGQAARDDDEEAEELQELIQRGGIPLVYQRWIQLQVTQWAAIDILSSYSRRAHSALQNVDMSIRLLSVTRQRSGTMDDWRAVIEKLVSQQHLIPFIPATSVSELNATEVVKFMERQILYHAKLNSNPIFRKFAKKPENEEDFVVHRCKITLDGQRHCEAVLACLMKYLKKLLNPQSPAYKAIKV